MKKLINVIVSYTTGKEVCYDVVDFGLWSENNILSTIREVSERSINYTISVYEKPKPIDVVNHSS